MKNFENWETQDLEMTFGISRNFSFRLLDEWLKAAFTFDDHTKIRIERLRQSFFEFAEYWNEDELKMQGISVMLDIADFRDKRFTAYSQRSISATINGIELGGRVDYMIARGFQKPIKPYFFIHEYKQEKRRDGDPKGQLLAELMVAQHRNESKMPVYGCYVLGANWRFMILHGKEYAVSNTFNASDDDIYQIIAILRQVKVYIEGFIAAEQK